MNMEEKDKRLEYSADDYNEAIAEVRFNMSTIELKENSAKRVTKARDLAIKALEKQIPKKPVRDGCYDKNGVWHEWNGINGKPYELCPNCQTNLCCEMPYDKKPNFCDKCGQKLDWSEKE